MNKTMLLALLAAAVALGLIIGTLAATAGGAPRMDTEELNDRLGQADLVIIDVRSRFDWDNSDMKIKGARREIPFDAQTWAINLDKNKTYVLYCA